MPSVSLLSSGSVTIKNFTARIVEFFRGVVNSVVVGEEPIETVDEDDKSKALEGLEKSEEAIDEKSLFPKRHNVDASLFGNSSVIPCSMDITALDTPMTLSATPEGHISCKLNTQIVPEGTNLKSLTPISPESYKAKTPTDESPSMDANGKDADEKGFYVCHYCDAKFRIRGYLTRHIKKHAIQKAYHCPFFNADAPPDLRCHNSGGFSRRDTYKTHLKARHFIYPKGVKPQDRNKFSGHCAQCGQFFENTDNWVEQHIETGQCKGLPKNYLKNIKSERKSGKLRMIKVSTGHSRFISTAQSVVEPKVLLNKEALEAMAIVAQNTNRSDILSKYGNNKIMMSSTNYKDEPKSKKKYARRKVKEAEKLKRESDENSTQPSSSEGTPLDNPGGFSCGSSNTVASEYMDDDEVALNEISSSINLSPQDHHVLEPVPSSSSESSHEEHDQLFTNKNENSKNQIDIATFPPVVFNDPFSAPLDMEQCSYANGTYAMDNSYGTNRNGLSSQIAINENLRNEMNPVLLGEKVMRDNEQFLNFYNYTFGSNL